MDIKIKFAIAKQRLEALRKFIKNYGAHVKPQPPPVPSAGRPQSDYVRPPPTPIPSAGRPLEPQSRKWWNPGSW